jgi:hypothetical protein
MPGTERPIRRAACTWERSPKSGEHQRLPIGLWQSPGEGLQAASELLAAVGVLGLLLVVPIGLDASGQADRRRRHLSLARLCSVVIGDRVARDLVCECVEPVFVAQAFDVAVEAQQYLLRDVVGRVWIAHPPPYEGAQPLVHVRPDLMRTV